MERHDGHLESPHTPRPPSHFVISPLVCQHPDPFYLVGYPASRFVSSPNLYIYLDLSSSIFSYPCYFVCTIRGLCGNLSTLVVRCDWKYMWAATVSASPLTIYICRALYPFWIRYYVPFFKKPMILVVIVIRKCREALSCNLLSITTLRLLMEWKNKFKNGIPMAKDDFNLMTKFIEMLGEGLH